MGCNPEFRGIDDQKSQFCQVLIEEWKKRFERISVSPKSAYYSGVFSILNKYCIYELAKIMYISKA